MSPVAEPVLVEVDGRRLALSNLDKVPYPRVSALPGRR